MRARWPRRASNHTRALQPRRTVAEAVERESGERSAVFGSEGRPARLDQVVQHAEAKHARFKRPPGRCQRGRHAGGGARLAGLELRRREARRLRQACAGLQATQRKQGVREGRTSSCICAARRRGSIAAASCAAVRQARQAATRGSSIAPQGARPAPPRARPAALRPLRYAKRAGTTSALNAVRRGASCENRRDSPVEPALALDDGSGTKLWGQGGLGLHGAVRPRCAALSRSA